MRFASFAHNADIGAPAGARIKHVKGIGVRLDAGDNLLARPDPLRRIAYVGNVLMRAQ